jgi:energy-coupling factor transport system permease protein
MTYIVSVFLVSSWIGYLLVIAFLAGLVLASKVPFSFMIKGLRSMVVLLVVMLVFHVLFTPGTVLWKLGFVKITTEGLMQGAKMVIRLVVLILGSSIMTLTTTPNQLTDGLERLLKPLGKIKIPVHELAMMMSIALRFIPILLEETDKIMKAQTARGADFEHGGLIQRVKNMVPLLIPLFVSAFRRANDLALAMEARCYHGGSGRTQMKPLQYRRRDGVAYIVLLGYVGMILLVRCCLNN